MRLAAQGRGGDEANHAGEQEWLAAEEIAELAGDRHHDRRCHQVGRDDPGVIVEAVQFSHDSRHRRPDDRLVERGEQQRQHGPADDPDRPPTRQPLSEVTALRVLRLDPAQTLRAE